jgi:hypothetical protein
VNSILNDKFQIEPYPTIISAVQTFLTIDEFKKWIISSNFRELFVNISYIEVAKMVYSICRIPQLTLTALKVAAVVLYTKLLQGSLDLFALKLCMTAFRFIFSSFVNSGDTPPRYLYWTYLILLSNSIEILFCSSKRSLDNGKLNHTVTENSRRSGILSKSEYVDLYSEATISFVFLSDIVEKEHNKKFLCICEYFGAIIVPISNSIPVFEFENDLRLQINNCIISSTKELLHQQNNVAWNSIYSNCIAFGFNSVVCVEVSPRTILSKEKNPGMSSQLLLINFSFSGQRNDHFSSKDLEELRNHFKVWIKYIEIETDSESMAILSKQYRLNNQLNDEFNGHLTFTQLFASTIRAKVNCILIETGLINN